MQSRFEIFPPAWSGPERDPMVTKSAPMNGSPAALREVLVLDANEDHQTLSAIALGRRGFKVTAVASGKEGVRLALTHPFEAIVLDHKVRELSSFEVLEALVERLPHTPKIFVVAPGTEDQAVKALSAGATGYLVKTARYNEVLPMEVEDQIEKARIKARVQEQSRALAAGLEERRKVEEAMQTFEERIGRSPRLFVAGRWSEDTTTAALLRQEGFTHDASALPGFLSQCAD